MGRYVLIGDPVATIPTATECSSGGELAPREHAYARLYAAMRRAVNHWVPFEFENGRAADAFVHAAWQLRGEVFLLRARGKVVYGRYVGPARQARSSLRVRQAGGSSGVES